MTNKDGTLLTTSSCLFELNINDPIPEDTVLVKKFNECAIHEADSIIVLGHSDGSCYAEVVLDYYTKKMVVQLTHVTLLQSTVDPYDDMFGFAHGIKSVVQYKINGNLETEKVLLITRIQCKTFDNCALHKLRKLLPNLAISEPRLNTFKETVKLLNMPHSKGGSELSCVDGDDNEEKQCPDSEHRCRFSLSKEHALERDCDDSKPSFDIEYRFNVIEEIASGGADNLQKAFKFFYLCKTDLCNSDDHVVKVDHLLNSFALTSTTSINSKTTNANKNKTTTIKINTTTNPTNKKPVPQANHKGPRSNSISFVASFYHRSIIMFSLFIAIL